MKYTLLLICFIFGATLAKAQSFNINNIDTRITEAYGIDYVKKMKEKSPQRLKYLTHYLNNSFYIMTYAEGKEYKDISTVVPLKASTGTPKIDINDLSTFNVLLHSYKSGTAYKIGNTGKMIVFYSSNIFVQSYNELYP